VQASNSTPSQRALLPRPPHGWRENSPAARRLHAQLNVAREKKKHLTRKKDGEFISRGAQLKTVFDRRPKRPLRPPDLRPLTKSSQTTRIVIRCAAVFCGVGVRFIARRAEGGHARDQAIPHFNVRKSVMPPVVLDLRSADDSITRWSSIARCKRFAEGKIVAFPTETVYGIGGFGAVRTSRRKG